MGADGHIAIYDYQKVKEYLESDKEHYQPSLKYATFLTEKEAQDFLTSKQKEFNQEKIGYTRGSLYHPFFTVVYNDYQDLKPFKFPGYVCNWECNGKQACLVYWGDYFEYDYFEGCKWLEKWMNENACLVPDQEVWT